jgi:hypothetical protein
MESSPRPKLTIGVFSSMMLPTYIEESVSCHSTWETQAQKLGVPVFYHVGQVIDENLLNWPNIVQLPGVVDDYQSAFDKHFKGLKHLYETVDSEWYFSVGSDTYPNIKNILTMLAKYDSSQPRVIVGPHEYIAHKLGEETFDWYSGASGYFISRLALELILKVSDTPKEDWHAICEVNSRDDWKPACDVCFFYMIHKNQLPIEIIKEKQIHACDYNGRFYNLECWWGCHPNPQTLQVCHFMTPEKSLLYYHLIEDNTIPFHYELMAQTVSDINEHIHTLAKYAQQCETIVECGVRTVVSTWAFLQGLKDNQSATKKMVCVDLNYNNGLELVKSVAKKHQIDFSFVMGDSARIDLAPVDLLFIDTWHVYGHLKRELAKHHGITQKYIILHDTTVDEFHGETLRSDWDPVQQSIESGYSVEEISKGLWPAITEFLAEHPEWVLEHRYTNNNGLTILKRIA